MLGRTVWIGSLVLCLALAPSASAQLFEHSYAIVIGIDDYHSARFPKLKYAVKDAEAIAAYLRNQGYDKIITLYNQQATKQAILEAMQNSVAPRLKANDRVLVFFAGHGYTETLGGKDRGYIVPFDGATQSASYISMEELQNESSYMGNARHQLFIMDSCFGGLMADTRASLVDTGVPDYLGEVTKRYAREVISAGGPGQQVVDGGPKGHSFFVDYLLEALQDGLADLNRDGYITFDELSAYLIPRASNALQTPASGVLPGHGAGEYLFKVTNNNAKAAVNQDKVPAGATRGALPRQATDAGVDESMPSLGKDDAVKPTRPPAASSSSEADSILRSIGREPKGSAASSVDIENKYQLAAKAFTDKDWDTAFRSATEAAQAGHLGAMSLLGRLYYLGRGTPQNAGLAKDWYEKSAAGGFCGAMYMLGLYYNVGGNGFPQDSRLSQEWFRKGANSTPSDACASNCRKRLLAN
jgi:uncharacterized caspase-like protein